MTFKIHFVERKLSNIDSNFPVVCCQGSTRQHASIGLGNGLVRDMQQAIIWTDDGMC